jgi:hypothetical protein
MQSIRSVGFMAAIPRIRQAQARTDVGTDLRAWGHHVSDPGPRRELVERRPILG